MLFLFTTHMDISSPIRALEFNRMGCTFVTLQWASPFEYSLHDIVSAAIDDIDSDQHHLSDRDERYRGKTAMLLGKPQMHT